MIAIVTLTMAEKIYDKNSTASSNMVNMKTILNQLLSISSKVDLCFCYSLKRLSIDYSKLEKGFQKNQ